jgi:tyrosine-protein phosphatase YwqE
MNKPIHLDEGIFLMLSKGYKPILAHPERYLYFQNKLNDLRDLKEKGVYFQVNTNSLVGFYNSDAKKTAELLVKNEMVNFLGSDVHNDYHMSVLPKSLSSKTAHLANSLTLLNNGI